MSKSKVYIGRIPRGAKPAELEDEFKKYGDVKNFDLRSGYGFVEYNEIKDAEEAIEKIHNKEFDGTKIVVEWAKEDTRSRDKGPNTKDFCYNCGGKGHWANECRDSSWKNKCYKCGEKGHLKTDCPRSRSISPATLRRKRRSPSRSRSKDRHRSRRSHRRDRSDSRSRSRSRSKEDRRRRNKSRSRSPKKSRNHHSKDKRREKRSKSKSRSPVKSESKPKTRDNKRRDKSSSSD